MESVASSSTPQDHHHRPHPRFGHNQPVKDRIARALHHHLRLLHRADSIFFVLGATGNVYTVTLSSSPSCTCPDRIRPCKHILFVYIKVLGVSTEDTCLRWRTLSVYHLNRLLKKPTSVNSLAGAPLRERFRNLFFQERNRNNDNGDGVERVEDGSTCPICLEEMAGKQQQEGRKVVRCRTCKNWIHEECFMRWKRSGGRRMPSCVICRAKWTTSSVQENYLNLGAYVHQEDDVVVQQADNNNDGGGDHSCGG